jgi:hypothetical protein
LPPRTVLLACAALAAAVVAPPARADAPAAAAAPACAATTDPATPAAATPGAPCWSDVDPYPFGADGNPVDATTPDCRPAAPSGPNYAGDQRSCYLKVDSLAFRAWNRGLAATSVAFSADLSATTAFGVWIFNGTRWFPDPTFPGQSVCKGNSVLWAGKRDYWLVGARVRNWPGLCRFDGVNFEWQPLDLPKATLDRVPLQEDGTRGPGAINAGSCLSWDNCWFFGSYGVVVHWDGAALKDASTDLQAQPWLRTGYTAAVTGTDASGAKRAFAVGTSGGVTQGEQLPPRPDGGPPPQLFASGGGAFAPLGYSPPALARPGDPYRTDLAAIAMDDQGRPWVAGNPVGAQPGSGAGAGGGGATSRRGTTPEPSPLARLTSDGTTLPCSALPSGRFRFPSTPRREDGYLWSSIAVLPGAADALVGGQLTPASPGPTVNDDGSPEPVLVRAGCDGTPVVTRFRMPDPYVAAPATAPPVPADRGGFVTSVAANAANDAWATTGPGALVRPTDINSFAAQRPHIYRLTDGRAPRAPAGDDDEPRPLVFQPDPPIFVELPPDPEPPPAPDTTVTSAGPKTTRQVRLKPAVYGVTAKVETKRGIITLKVKFKVRRAVTIGVQALRSSRVVSSSGLKRFTAPQGRLALRLDRRRWPTRIRFVSPPAKAGAALVALAPQPAGTALPR